MKIKDIHICKNIHNPSVTFHGEANMCITILNSHNVLTTFQNTYIHTHTSKVIHTRYSMIATTKKIQRHTQTHRHTHTYTHTHTHTYTQCNTTMLNKRVIILFKNHHIYDATTVYRHLCCDAAIQRSKLLNFIAI